MKGGNTSTFDKAALELPIKFQPGIELGAFLEPFPVQGSCRRHKGPFVIPALSGAEPERSRSLNQPHSEQTNPTSNFHRLLDFRNFSSQNFGLFFYSGHRMEEFLSLVGFLDVDFESQMGPRDFFQVFLGRRGEIPPLLSGISFILRSHRIIKTLGITEGCESFEFQGFAQALLQIHLTGCSVPASPCGKRNPICVGKARAGWGIGDLENLNPAARKSFLHSTEQEKYRVKE